MTPSAGSATQMQSRPNRPSLFFVHGAAGTPDTFAKFQENFLDGSSALRSLFGDLVFSAWREETPLRIGPAGRAFPKSSKAGRALFSRAPGAMRNAAFGLLGHQFVGDVITYAAQRNAILATVRRHLSAMTADRIVVVGHSLGGVILVDLLNDSIEAPDPRVEALVTLGSPASYLYSLNALPGFPFNDQARPFGPWINVWDAADPIASVATTVFTAEREPRQPVLDVEVTSSTDVVKAHSAYWKHWATWVSISMAADANGEDSIPDGSIVESQLRDLVHSRSVQSDRRLLDLATEIERATARVDDAVAESKSHVLKIGARIDVYEIGRGAVPLRLIEATGAEYFRSETMCYARPAIRQALDDAHVKHLVARYASLRPPTWVVGDETWLVLPAAPDVLVSDEARGRLAREGVVVFLDADLDQPAWS